jgi:hypothetical protein
MTVMGDGLASSMNVFIKKRWPSGDNGLGRNGQEVRAILPGHPIQANQLHVRFVNQARRVERVIRPLTAPLAARDGFELLIKDWVQPVDGGSAAVTERVQQLCDFVAPVHRRLPRARFPFSSQVSGRATGEPPFSSIWLLEVCTF